MDDIALGRRRGDTFGEVHGSPNIQPRKYKQCYLGYLAFRRIHEKGWISGFNGFGSLLTGIEEPCEYVTTARVEVKGRKQAGSNRATTVLVPNL